jgi:hypothetical protein
MNTFIMILVGVMAYLPFSDFNLEQNIQNDCACCTIEHNQFDFWIGEWNVYDTIGNLVGENTIASIQDHCVIEENWKSKSGTGTSYNYYDNVDSTWNQVWIDNKGRPLVLKGRFNDGKMILRSKLTKGQKINEFYNQITWQKMPDETVVQTWEALDPDLKSIAVIFKGIYKKK